MKKFLAIAFCFIVFAGLFVFAACKNNCDTYEAAEVKENSLGYTMENFTKFQILLYRDGSYQIKFSAKGMPVVVSEKGTYKIQNNELALKKESGSELIQGIESYKSKEGEILAICKDKDSNETYSVLFRITNLPDYSKQEGTYGIKTLGSNSANITIDSFTSFTIKIEADGVYEVSYILGTEIRTERGRAVIKKEKLTLSKSSDEEVGISDLLISGKTISGQIAFESEKTKITFEKDFTHAADETYLDDVSAYIGKYLPAAKISGVSEMYLQLNANKTYTVSAVAKMGEVTETGTFNVTSKGVLKLTNTGGQSLVTAITENTTTSIKVVLIMGSAEAILLEKE